MESSQLENVRICERLMISYLHVVVYTGMFFLISGAVFVHLYPAWILRCHVCVYYDSLQYDLINDDSLYTFLTSENVNIIEIF
jgi:hypothetical protein